MKKLRSCKGRTEDGRAWRLYEIRGKKVRVIDDFENAMLISEMYEDKALTDEEKTRVLLFMVLPEPQRFFDAFGEESPAAFRELMLSAFGIDTNGGEENPVMDWDEDASRIKATMLSVYGLDDCFMQLPYREVCELIGMADHDSPMGQALYYRTAKKPKRTKYNKEQVETFNKAKDFYKLGKKENSIERANAKASSMFNAIAGGSNGRRPGDNQGNT